MCFGRAWINSNLPPRYAPRSDERPWSQDLRRPDSRSRRRSRSPRSSLNEPVSNKGASGRPRRRGRGHGRGQKASKSLSQSEPLQPRPRSHTVGSQTGPEYLRRALEEMQAAATSKEKNQDKGAFCPVPGCEVRTKLMRFHAFTHLPSLFKQTVLKHRSVRSQVVQALRNLALRVCGRDGNVRALVETVCSPLASSNPRSISSPYADVMADFCATECWVSEDQFVPPLWLPCTTASLETPVNNMV